MRKSKHFRKDVIIARIIAALLLILLIAIISFVVSALVEPSADADKDSQNKESQYQEQDNWWDDDMDTNPLVPENSELQDTSEDTTEDALEPENDEVLVKTTAQVKFRSGPGTNYDVIGYIEKDVEVELLEEVYGWYKISYDGKEGYISADYSRKVE